MGVCNAEASLLHITETRFARGEIDHMVEDMKRAEPGMKWADFAWLHVYVSWPRTIVDGTYICMHVCISCTPYLCIVACFPLPVFVL